VLQVDQKYECICILYTDTLCLQAAESHEINVFHVMVRAPVLVRREWKRKIQRLHVLKYRN
jgi:hypothetical protein